MKDSADLPSVYQTMNAGFVQEMYEQYLRDPASVDPEWRLLFENGGRGLEPVPASGERRAESGRGPESGERRAESDSTPGTGAQPPASSALRSPPSALPKGEHRPLKGAAARLVQNMEASLGVPTATSYRDVAVAELDARRKALNAAIAPRKISYTHLIAWALVQAARQHPVMVHAFADVDGTPTRIVPEGISLGLAVDVEKKDGSRTPVVPVIKRADTTDFAAFLETYESLVAKARTGSLLPDAYQGATMTLTNPGTLGTVASMPRLMAGQGSIIATGAIRESGAGRVMTISSTYDHRIIQGAESGVFLRTVEALLQGGENFYALGIEETGNRQSAIGNEKTGNGQSASGNEKTGNGQSASGNQEAGNRQSAIGNPGLRDVAAAMALVRAHRLHGHALAQLDPLGTPPRGDPACDAERLELTPEAMAQIPADVLRVYVPGATMADVLPALRAVYCGTIAYQFEHIASHEERVWLREIVETGGHRAPLTAETKRKLLGRLTAVDALERFLHKTYLGQKRFSIEGLDAAVPMLDLLVEQAGEDGASDVVIGMAHRGRLNVLAHVVNLPYDTILGEFESHGSGGMKPDGGTGDVKYHHGAEGSAETPSGRRVTVTLLPNPSHLEAVNPVVAGRTRAEQTRRSAAQAQHDTNAAIAVLLHGDAAFSGQGVVAETLNMEQLRGYTVGGTIHIITNNQVGFTTDPRDARSTWYASDMARGFDVPIVHVNADDPEAALAAVNLAMMYRERYHKDFLIDLVGYRRWGHNEGDEPSYTQPVLYEKIRKHQPVRQLYAAQLEREKLVSGEQAEKLAAESYQRLSDAQAAVKRRLAGEPDPQEPRRAAGSAPAEPDTTVPAETLRRLNEELLAVKDGFTVNPKLKKQLDRRRETIAPGGGMEWAHAEALAFASLLAYGVPVRLTGQDTERGTFSQRHLMLHDNASGERYAPIQHLPSAAAPMELYNSPLSEYACLGFEYGYAVAAPEALVLWEAQFGDFVNGAEIVIDQFIFAGYAKWGATSRLTLLLPHGYEGQGPEHSSARLERFVALGAERNIRVANCTTPAQYFHLLRRQALHAEMRPLVVMTPKSLLRLPAATSSIEELAGGAFQPVLDDVDAALRAAEITRLVLCSGKIFYELVQARPVGAKVAIARLELLYPQPREELKALIARYPKLKEIVWAQEEPYNMGARKFIMPELRALAPKDAEVRDVSRPERASPAEGYPAAHTAEQARIVGEALGG